MLNPKNEEKNPFNNKKRATDRCANKAKPMKEKEKNKNSNY